MLAPADCFQFASYNRKVKDLWSQIHALTRI